MSLGAGGRRSLADPALADPVLVGVVALGVYALRGFQGILDRDLGLFVYGGEEFARGVPPYHDVFNSVGPLADMIPGVGILAGRLVGLDPVLSARLLYVVLAALCCSATSVLARETTSSRPAGLVAPAVFLLFTDFSHLAANGPREKTAMLVFSTVALLLVQRRRYAAAGAFAALATLTWQPALVVSVGAMVAAALLEQRRRLPIVLRFVAGGAAVTLAMAVYLAANGALSAAVDGFVLINLIATHQASVFSDPSFVWTQVWGGYHLSLVLLLGGLAALLTLAVRAIPCARPGRRADAEVDELSRRLVVAGAGTLAGTVWSCLVINGAPDLFLLLPTAALGVSALLLSAARRGPALIGTRVQLGLAALAVVVAGTQAVVSRDDTLVTERADVRAVLATQPRSTEVMSVDAPQVLAISQRRNTTSYQLFNRRMRTFLDRTRPGGVDGILDEMAERRPTFLVVSLRINGPWLRSLLRHYDEVGPTLRWTWYLRKSAGPVALDRARRANAAAMAGG